MGYYIFHDKAIGEAQIHYGDCPHCRHGYGCSDAVEERREGEWLGPFSSYHEAERAAKIAKACMQECAECMP